MSGNGLTLNPTFAYGAGVNYGRNQSDLSVDLTSYNLDGKGGTGKYPTTPGGVQELNERDRVEAAEEFNLKNCSRLQIWMRVLSTFIAEFLPDLLVYTMVLVATATGAGPIGRALVGGIAMIAALSVFVRENGVHLDPVITISMTILGKLGLPWYFMFAHLLAQLTAIITACLFVWALTPGFDRSLGLGTDHLAFGYTPGQGFFAQLLGCLWMYTIFLWLVCAVGKKNYYEQMAGVDNKNHTLFTLAVGFAQVSAVLSVGNVVGGHFNMLLYLFPAAISGTIDTSNWWIWPLGSLMAGVFQMGIYFLYNWVDSMAWQPAFLLGGPRKEHNG